jgi:hypothetical protein
LGLVGVDSLGSLGVTGDSTGAGLGGSAGVGGSAGLGVAAGLGATTGVGFDPGDVGPDAGGLGFVAAGVGFDVVVGVAGTRGWVCAAALDPAARVESVLLDD